MSHGIVSTGISFPDGSVQTTAQASGYSLLRKTTPGTYTLPGGVKNLKVTVVGGGGGSGGAKGLTSLPVPNTYTAGGGGGGGTTVASIPRADILTAYPTGSVPFTIGVGGSAGSTPGTNATTTSGTAGGTSSFGTLASATGGGANSTTNGGNPGVGTDNTSSISFKGASRSYEGNNAGLSSWLFTGNNKSNTVNTPGDAADTYGGGASGGIATTTPFAVAGAAGFQGILIIEEFY